MHSRHKPPRGCLADIENYFQQPPPRFLDLELAVCWVLDCLLHHDSYPSGLLQQLEKDHPQLRLSETVLHQALDFLDRQEMLTHYSERCPSRGRPRRMLHLHENARGQAQSLMPAWHQWLQQRTGSSRVPVAP